MLFLDILLLIITCVCIAYCFILNRRIADLQNSRVEFARMIKELNSSIVKAEHNVNQMTELSKVTSEEIKNVVTEAREVSDELTKAEEVAINMLEQLDDKTSHAINVLSEDESQYYDRMSAGAGEKFTDDDLPEVEDSRGAKYTNQLKNFIQKVSNSTKQVDNAKLNQASYYSTLRKINAKR